MGLADVQDAVRPCNGDPHARIGEQIQELIDGPVARRKSDKGYTYYVGMVRKGRSFTTVQPNIWIYVDPSVRSGITVSHPPEIVTVSDEFEPVPSKEKWGNSFGHRATFDPVPDCELSDDVKVAILKSYKQVERPI